MDFLNPATAAEATAARVFTTVDTAVAANIVAGHPMTVKVADDTQVRSDAWVAAKVAVPADAAKAGVPVAGVECSARAI